MSSVTFFGLHGPFAALAVTCAVITGLAAAAAAFRGLWRFFRRLGRFFEQFLGEPDTGKGGVLDRLNNQDTALAHLLHEIPPNGVPLRADVDAIKEAVEQIGRAQKVTDINVSDLRKAQRKFQRDHRQLEARWIAAMRAQDIDTPEPRP